MSQDELDLVSTEDLISALERRCECSVVGIARLNNDGNTTDTEMFYSGGLNSALGIAVRLQSSLVEKARENMRG